MAYESKKTSTNYFNKLFLNQDCTLTTAFESIQGRWTTQVLVSVYMGRNRFGLIKEQLPGITDNVLALRLNHLVKNKLLLKKTVDLDKTYSLNESGKGLVEILENLAKWQEKRSGVKPGTNRCLILQK